MYRDTINAFWVLLKYIDKVDLESITKETDPAGISFIMNHKAYVIYALGPIPEDTVDLINKSTDSYEKLIIVCNSKDEAMQLPAINKPHYFALLDCTQEEPAVTWLKPKE